MEQFEAVSILEALLFTADEPLTPDQIAGIFEDTTPDEARALADALNRRYTHEGAGLQVQEVAGGFRLTTRPDLAPWVQRLNRVRPARLSRAALETLAVIAYRQPITKAEIEGVRGVSADGVLRTLLERDLIRVMGRKPDVGRPILYGTTRVFLEHFGFKDLTDLPTLREIEEILAENEARRAADLSDSLALADSLSPAGGEGQGEGGGEAVAAAPEGAAGRDA
jgi:segregation and condensation protein B